MTTLVTSQVLAKRLGVTSRQLYAYIDLGIPTEKKGNRRLFPIKEATEWFHEYQNKGNPKKNTGSYSEARLREKLADAALKELKLAQQEGELVTLNDAQELMSKKLEIIRSKWLAIPGKYAPQFVNLPTPQDARTALATVINQIMEEIVSEQEIAHMQLDNSQGKDDEED